MVYSDFAFHLETFMITCLLRKSWYIYTMEYYSAIKKNTCESVLMMWMKPEPIIQRKSERKTPIQYINASIWNLERW